MHSRSPTILCIYVITIFPRSVATATINFSFTEVWRLFKGGVYSARRTSTVSRHTPSAHVNFVLGLSRSHLRARWLTLSSSLPSSPFHQRFMAIVCTSLQTLVFASATVKGVKSIARRQRDRFYTSAHAHCNCSYEMWLLFKGGHYYAQLVFCAVPIRGRCLFGVRRLFKEIRYFGAITSCIRHLNGRQ